MKNKLAFILIAFMIINKKNYKFPRFLTKICSNHLTIYF